MIKATFEELRTRAKKLGFVLLMADNQAGTFVALTKQNDPKQILTEYMTLHHMNHFLAGYEFCIENQKYNLK